MYFFTPLPKQVIFLTKTSKILSLTTETRIVLSPEYYWVKKVSLPVGTLREAKRYAPAIFEEYLPEGESYAYFVQKAKETGAYIFVAYAPDVITHALKIQLGDLSKVYGIYFTQFEIDLDTCVAVDNTHAMVSVDETILYVPHSCSQTQNLQQLLEAKKPTHNYFKPTDHKPVHIDRRYVLSSIIIAVLFLLAFGLDGWYHQRLISRNAAQMDTIRKEAQMPATSIQTKSILKRLQKIASVQKKYRALLKNVDKMPLPQGTVIQELSLHNGQLTLRLKLSQKDAVDQIEHYFRQKGLLQDIETDAKTCVIRLQDG